MHKRTDLTAWIPAILSVLCLAFCLVLPSPITQRLTLLAAHAALPEGIAVSLHNAQTVQRTEKTPAQPVSAALPQDILQTPADILAWMEEAQQKSAAEKKDGDIVGQTFGAKAATERFHEMLIRNVTEDVQPNYDAVWNTDLPLKIDKTKPAVLIYHTHTTEGYELLDRDWYAADVSSRTEDTNRNVARVGSAIAEELERAGFVVLHDLTVHDRQYNGAYDRSRETVQSYLDRYPQLMVTLDVHRDAIQQNDGKKIKPIQIINGKKSAQIMIISGAEGGKVTGFPDWQQNLGFALRLQDACETTAPGLMRPIFFCHRKYNMDMTPCSLLVEFGSDANTLEEAVYAGRLFGRALSSLLEAYITEQGEFYVADPKSSDTLYPRTKCAAVPCARRVRRLPCRAAYTVHRRRCAGFRTAGSCAAAEGDADCEPPAGQAPSAIVPAVSRRIAGADGQSGGDSVLIAGSVETRDTVVAGHFAQIAE